MQIAVCRQRCAKRQELAEKQRGRAGTGGGGRTAVAPYLNSPSSSVAISPSLYKTPIANRSTGASGPTAWQKKRETEIRRREEERKRREKESEAEKKRAISAARTQAVRRLQWTYVSHVRATNARMAFSQTLAH